MPKVLTFATLKGGAGKTMNLFNLAGMLVSQGKKVLLIDCDPQCNLSANCGIDIADMNFFTVKDIFEKYKESEQPSAKEAIVKHPIEKLDGLDIIPSSILLFDIEEALMILEGRTKILHNFIRRNSADLAQYDYIFCDTNPSMSVFNINAFYAADAIIICTDVSSNSISGAELFCGLWDAKREQINETSEIRKEDNIEALLIGNFAKRSKLSRELLEYVHTATFSKDIVLDTIIPETVQLKDTEISHKPISLTQKPGNAAFSAFKNLTKELTRKGIL